MPDIQIITGERIVKQPQACVRFVDVDVNIPETLARSEPLSFGSPDLRPPRGDR